MFRLIDRDDNVVRHSIETDQLILVGRGPQCDVVLHDPSASRVHCRLLLRDGRVFLTDAGSRWGTFVNGLRVAECELRPGDRILIGETNLTLHASEESQGTTLARPPESQQQPGLTVEPGEEFGSPGWNAPMPRQNAPATQGCPEMWSPAEFLGRTLLGCRIEELLARTQRGLVFRSTRGDIPLAFKVYHSIHLRDETPRQRFMRAIDVARQLRHPHVVELLDGGFHEGLPYTISEYVAGEPATDVIRRIGVAGMLDWRRTVAIATDLVSALEFLESNGVLHRNIHPRHLLIRKSDGCAKLNDLLLSKAMDDSFPALTQAGDLVGDLPFMSPEQMGSGQPIDHRSDLYQCGATLYALLTGRPPFEAAQPARLMEMAANEPPIPPTRYHLAIPSRFECMVLTMLSKRPQDRYQSASDILQELEQVRRLTIA